MKQAKKKGLNPVVAVLFLLISAGVAARQLFGGASAPDAGPAAVDESMPPDENDGETAAKSSFDDLLAAYGSFDASKPVRLAFATAAMPLTAAAAPAGETRPKVTVAWTGEDPPAVQVGVVMISDVSRRAVVDGRIVGVGDSAAVGRIVAIESGSVAVRWNGRVLTYDLADPVPREFRGEAQRRRAKTESAPNAEPKVNQEEGK